MKNKVFVGGLNWSTTEQELSDAFSTVGQITEAKVIRDRETGKSRGFGFVTFVDEATANLAVEKLDGTDLSGRTLRVNIAEDRKPPRPGGGGGYGGGGYGGGGYGGGGGGYGGGGGGYGGGRGGGNRWD